MDSILLEASQEYELNTLANTVKGLCAKLGVDGYSILIICCRHVQIDYSILGELESKKSRV